jgi:hypothetical protein
MGRRNQILYFGFLVSVCVHADYRDPSKSEYYKQSDDSISELVQQNVFSRLKLGRPDNEAVARRATPLLTDIYWRLTADESLVQVNNEKVKVLGLQGEEKELSIGFNNVLSNVMDTPFGENVTVDKGEFEKWRSKNKKYLTEHKLYYAVEQSDAGKPRLKKEVSEENYIKYFKALKMYNEAELALTYNLEVDLNDLQAAQASHPELTNSLNKFVQANLGISAPKDDAKMMLESLENSRNAFLEALKPADTYFDGPLSAAHSKLRVQQNPQN